MTYFPDLSNYTYIPARPNTVPTFNVGWLDTCVDFPIAPPADELLERIWRFCAISVSPTRGLHGCPFCAPARVNFTERGDSKLLLGSAELRVFTADGKAAFAAPNLIYHYIAVHEYCPPATFLEALGAGPQPSEPQYSEQLKAAELRWTVIPLLDSEPAAFRGVKRDGKTDIEKL